MRLHHVGIVVDNIESQRARYRDFFGLEPVSGVVTDEVQQVKVQFLAGGASDSAVELIEPLPGESPVRRALEKGGGLSHLCFEAADVADAVANAVSNGALAVGQPVPAAAFDGRPIAFVYYRGIGLVEFVEAARA